jgi:alanine racemase
MIHHSKYLKTWVELDSRAIQHNFRAIQKHVGKDMGVMCVVKSNAYGHGLIEVAKALHAFRSFSEGGWFGVDSIDEALTLKKIGIQNKILILGYIPKQRFSDVIRNGFRFSLYDIHVLKECARIAKKWQKKAYVHLKLESGTYRQGIETNELSLFAKELQKSPHVISEGVYTHFADTENIKSSYYKQQLHFFKKNVSLLEELGLRFTIRHTAASAAAFLYPDTHFDMIRIGISLYGMYPSEDVRSSVSNNVLLRPALMWKTRVVQVKVVPKGMTIGYNRAFTALQQMKIAVLPVGYWDGYDRYLSNRGAILIGGRKVSIVGNICMNMCMVDITGVPHVTVGDEAVLLGKQGNRSVTVEEIAMKIDSINYEVSTRINPLILRLVR